MACSSLLLFFLPPSSHLCDPPTLFQWTFLQKGHVTNFAYLKGSECQVAFGPVDLFHAISQVLCISVCPSEKW